MTEPRTDAPTDAAPGLAAGPATELAATTAADVQDAATFESFFREPGLAHESAQAWALGQRLPLIDALRGLFSGPQAGVQLRLWCLLELAAVPQARLSRDDIQRLFHSLRPDALDTALKRLRELALLVWDATAQDYHLSTLAQTLVPLLMPLATPVARPDDGEPAAPLSPEDEEMGALLAQVAGAQQLGLVNANQLKHLHAQLGRLHDEFADAIASGSESRLRAAQPRFDRALDLVARAGEALTALIRADHVDPRLEREARAIGQEQARLLAMASQFTRALQQADRQRVTLGSTGLTTSDVRLWLQGHPDLSELMGTCLSMPVRPVFVSPHDLVDVAEAEFERDRPGAGTAEALPPPAAAADGTLDVLSLPPELGHLISMFGRWPEKDSEDGLATPAPRPLADAVLGGRFAQAAYRLQLMPLLGDAQAQTLNGMTGDLARSGWRWQATPRLIETTDEAVALISEGLLRPTGPEGEVLPLPVGEDGLVPALRATDTVVNAWNPHQATEDDDAGDAPEGVTLPGQAKASQATKGRRKADPRGTKAAKPSAPPKPSTPRTGT
ncbi:MAG: hypothetical protein RI907_3130 [Pseudomonadota bacterium]|jgi:hypothetical protein